jgi:enoyl-CoA hydratase/carnithine racemase
MSEIECTRRDSILVVALNRPEKRNALSSSMLRRLVEVFDEVARDEAVRAVVVRGAGDSFCSGLDLKELEEARSRAGEASLTDIQDAFRALARVPQPTIAWVQGAAIAGGCELALHCDLRVAAEDARFAMPLARLGLVLPDPLVGKLVETIGVAATKELLLTAEAVDAGRALALGLVNRVVPRGELESAGLRLAETIAANSPDAVRAMKRAVGRIGPISVTFR